MSDNARFLTLHESRGLFVKIWNVLSGKNGLYWKDIFNKVLRKENPFQRQHQYHITKFLDLMNLLKKDSDEKLQPNYFESIRVILLDVVVGVRNWTETFPDHPDYAYYKPCWEKFDSAKTTEDYVEAVHFLYTTGTWR